MCPHRTPTAAGPRARAARGFCLQERAPRASACGRHGVSVPWITSGRKEQLLPGTTLAELPMLSVFQLWCFIGRVYPELGRKGRGFCTSGPVSFLLFALSTGVLGQAPAERLGAVGIEGFPQAAPKCKPEKTNLDFCTRRPSLPHVQGCVSRPRVRVCGCRARCPSCWSTAPAACRGALRNPAALFPPLCFTREMLPQ